MCITEEEKSPHMYKPTMLFKIKQYKKKNKDLP